MQALVHELVELVSNKVQLFEDREYLDTVSSLLYDAAEFGNSEFLNILIRSYPNIIWTIDKDGRSLFHIAVINRQESVFNLLYETVAVKEIILTNVIEGKNENVMHLAGYLAPLNRLNIVSGAANGSCCGLRWVLVCIIYFSFIFLCVHNYTYEFTPPKL